MKPLYILLFTVLFCHFSRAQADYQRNKYVISAFVGIAPPLLNDRSRLNYPFDEDDVRLIFQRSALPPEIGMSFEIPVGLTTKISFQGSWRGLQNTGFIHETQPDNPPPNTISTYIDSFHLATDVINFAVAVKSNFLEIANSPYILFGTGISSMQSTVYPTQTYTESEIYGPKEYVETTKSEPGGYNSIQMRLMAGLGYTVQTKSHLVLDFGIRSSYYFGKRSYTQPTDAGNNLITDYREYYESIIDYLHLTNIQSSNIVECYAKIGYYF